MLGPHTGVNFWLDGSSWSSYETNLKTQQNKRLVLQLVEVVGRCSLADARRWVEAGVRKGNAPANGDTDDNIWFLTMHFGAHDPIKERPLLLYRHCPNSFRSSWVSSSFWFLMLLLHHVLKLRCNKSARLRGKQHARAVGHVRYQPVGFWFGAPALGFARILFDSQSKMEWRVPIFFTCLPWSRPSNRMKWFDNSC